MKNILNFTALLMALGCLIGGGALIYNELTETAKPAVIENKKAFVLKGYLAKYGKPARVEINNLTKRLSSDVDEVKKIKVSLDQKSKFYISIDLFTDENDQEAPLIAQVKFMDVVTDNKIKEENINLE